MFVAPCNEAAQANEIAPSKVKNNLTLTFSPEESGIIWKALNAWTPPVGKDENTGLINAVLLSHILRDHYGENEPDGVLIVHTTGPGILRELGKIIVGYSDTLCPETDNSPVDAFASDVDSRKPPGRGITQWLRRKTKGSNESGPTPPLRPDQQAWILGASMLSFAQKNQTSSNTA